MRTFSYITVGRILDELKIEGLPLARVTFYRLEKRLELPTGKKTTGTQPWRIYSREEANTVKDRIKEEYRFPESQVQPS